MRVLVATDGSACADVAVDLITSLHLPAGSTIHAVQAVPSGVAVFGGPWPPISPADTSVIDREIQEDRFT